MRLARFTNWMHRRRRRLLLIIGGVATALFIVIRAINVYGDPFSVVAAEEHRLHAAFVFEYYKVSTFVAVSVDDTWSIDTRAGVF